MRRSTRIFKKHIATFLIVLMSINSFGAVVSDNDGSAFITKAEFDSLKNNFQSQIDQYNTSIDSKIDGAIASYLAGINVSKEETLKNLVSNYYDMMWVNTFKLYGRWRKWTSNTTKTEDLTDNWFVPALNEKRLAFRNNSALTIYDPIYSNDGYLFMTLTLTATEMYGGTTIGKRNGEGDGASQAHTPSLYIRFVKPAGKDYWVPDGNPFRNAYTLMNVQHVKPHANVNNGNFYLLRGKQGFFDPNFNPPFTALPITATNQIYNIEYHWAYGGTDTVEYTQTSYTQPKFSDFMFPYLWVDASAFNNSTNYYYDELSSYNPTAFLSSSIASMTHDYFQRGVTFQVLSGGTNRQKMIDSFLHMMFGKQSDACANAGYTVTDNGTQTYDFSTATASSLVNFKVTEANLVNPKYKDKGTTGGRENVAYVPSADTTISMTFPLWPTIALADINSNYFNYNNAPLTKGQGLPIASNIVSNGVLHINATYTTDRIISSYTNVGIEVDVADRAFTEQDVKYFDGYDDDVDPNTTTKTIKSLHNLEIDNTEKTIKLSIPVKKEDNVWLRIAPDTSDGGYFAKLSNLKVTLVTE